MRLTPLDIRKQEFTKSFRGFDPDEVQAFLQQVANQWAEMQDEHRRLEENLRTYDHKIKHYEKVEEALQEALQVARDTTHRTIANAEARAKMIIAEAKAEAEHIKHDAKRDQERLKREASQLTGRRHEIVARLRAFLMSEMELLAHFEGEDPYGFIKLMPSEQNAYTSARPQLEAPPNPAVAPAPRDVDASPEAPPTKTTTNPTPEASQPEHELTSTSAAPPEEQPHAQTPLEETLPLEPFPATLEAVPQPAPQSDVPDDTEPITSEPNVASDQPAIPAESTTPVDAPETEQSLTEQDQPTTPNVPHPSWKVNSVLLPSEGSPDAEAPASVTATTTESPQADHKKQKLSEEMQLLQRFLNNLD